MTTRIEPSFSFNAAQAHKISSDEFLNQIPSDVNANIVPAKRQPNTPSDFIIIIDIIDRTLPEQIA